MSFQCPLPRTSICLVAPDGCQGDRTTIPAAEHPRVRHPRFAGGRTVVVGGRLADPVGSVPDTHDPDPLSPRLRGSSVLVRPRAQVISAGHRMGLGAVAALRDEPLVGQLPVIAQTAPTMRPVCAATASLPPNLRTPRGPRERIGGCSSVRRISRACGAPARLGLLSAGRYGAGLCIGDSKRSSTPTPKERRAP